MNYSCDGLVFSITSPGLMVVNKSDIQVATIKYGIGASLHINGNDNFISAGCLDTAEQFLDWFTEHDGLAILASVINSYLVGKE